MGLSRDEVHACGKGAICAMVCNLDGEKYCDPEGHTQDVQGTEQRVPTRIAHDVPPEEPEEMWRQSFDAFRLAMTDPSLLHPHDEAEREVVLYWPADAS
jgi:hypothetical protein